MCDVESFFLTEFFVILSSCEGYFFRTGLFSIFFLWSFHQEDGIGLASSSSACSYLLSVAWLLVRHEIWGVAVDGWVIFGYTLLSAGKSVYGEKGECVKEKRIHIGG